jgi:hypothetical protein
MYISIVLIIFITLIESGCGTVMYMNKKYAGHKVINKKEDVETKKVPIRVLACVTPQGNVLCERRYGALTECSLKCKTPPNKWVERPTGYGGYEDKVFYNYYLVLESPDGKIETIQVSEPQYTEFHIGQFLGNSLP